MTPPLHLGPRQGRIAVAAAAVCLALCLPGLARASVGEIWGLSSRHAGMAGAGVGVASDYAAVYHNPAGLAGLQAPQLSFGFSDAVSFLEANGDRRKIPSSLGLHIGLAAPVPFGGFLEDRVTIALGMYIPPDEIVRVRGHAASEAYFPLYDNRTQRLMVMPGLALKLPLGIEVGVSVDVLAKLGGTIEVQQGSTRALEPDVREDLVTTATPGVGLRWSPFEGLSFGFSWRDAFEVPFWTRSNNRVANQPLDVSVRATTLNSPEVFAAGLGWAARHDLLIAVDYYYRRWSEWRGNYVDVQARIPFGIGNIPDIELRPRPTRVRFEDTHAGRVGAEWALGRLGPVDFLLRGGMGYEQTPVPAQRGVTNLLDGDKLLTALGLGVGLPDLLGRPVRLDFHAAMHFLRSRRHRKDPALLPDEDPMQPELQTDNPGFPTVEGSGSVLGLGLQITVGG